MKTVAEHRYDSNVLTKVEYGFNAVAKSPFLLLYATGSKAEM